MKTEFMPKATPKKRMQFSIGGLLIVFVVVAIILSRFYPRVHATVHVKISSPGQLDIHCMVARSSVVLSRATLITPETTALMESDRIQWLKKNIEARPVGKDTIEIRVVGYPKDRRQLQTIVDAVAKSYIKFIHSQQTTQTEIIADMQGTYDRLKQKDPSKTQLLKALDNRIQTLKQNLVNNPPPAKPYIVKRESKMGR